MPRDNSSSAALVLWAASSASARCSQGLVVILNSLPSLNLWWRTGATCGAATTPPPIFDAPIGPCNFPVSGGQFRDYHLVYWLGPERGFVRIDSVIPAGAQKKSNETCTEPWPTRTGMSGYMSLNATA